MANIKSGLAVFLFAAGEGKRLYPYTLHTAKPLLPISNQDTLLSLWLDKLNSHNLWLQVYINAARHYQAFADYLQKLRVRYPYLDVHLIHEASGPFETAGGLYQCITLNPQLQDTRMLLISSDIYSDCSPQSLFERSDFPHYHKPYGKNSCHFFYVENPKHHPQGDFALGTQLEAMPQGVLPLEGLGESRIQSVCYSGIAWIQVSEFVAYAEQLPRAKREYGKIADFFRFLIAKKIITTTKLEGYWQDTGRPEDLQALRQRFKGASINS